jgi:hypothetical protein
VVRAGVPPETGESPARRRAPRPLLGTAGVSHHPHRGHDPRPDPTPPAGVPRRHPGAALHPPGLQERPPLQPGAHRLRSIQERHPPRTATAPEQSPAGMARRFPPLPPRAKRGPHPEHPLEIRPSR